MAKLGRATGVVALLTAALWLTFGPGAIGYDASFALVWGEQLAGGELPDFETDIAPTPHPLANLVSAALSLLGDAALDAFLVITFASLALLGLFAYLLGERLFAPAVGVLFAAILITRPLLVNETQQALIDIPFLALTAAAAWVAAGRGRPLAVLVLLTLAGLLRPEAWPLALVYALIVRRGAAVALALAAPVLWALFDLVVTGDPLHSLHGTRELAAELGRLRSAESALTAAPEFLELILKAPVAWLGLAGCLAGLWFLYERSLAAAVVGGLGLGGFIVLGAAGLPVLTRYLLVPAAVLALFAAVAVLGWLALPADAPQRRPWMAAGALAAVLMLVSVPGTIDDNRAQASFMDGRREVQDGLLEIIRGPGGRELVERCETIATVDPRPAPLIAYWLDRAPDAVPTRRLARVPGMAFATYASEDAGRKLSLNSEPVPVPAAAPPGMRPAARNRHWVLYESCN